MLRELEVRDLGIIERVRLELPAGLVALTGETGAGKSLLVQSLQLLAGERSDAEQVRGGCERLLVQAVFQAPDGEALGALLDEVGAPRSEELVVRREVGTTGRSRAWVNDVTVTMGTLQRLAPFLVSIHGQHDQRSLADPSRHLELVDLAAGLEALRGEVGLAYEAWQAACARLAARRRALATRRDRLDVIAFQTREIEEVRPEAGEEAALLEERTFLRHAGRIGELLATARGQLGGEAGTAALARAARAMRELAGLGVGAEETAAALEQAQLLAEDAEREAVRLSERVRVDPQRLEAVEARLVVLERLFGKYGGSAEAALAHLGRLMEERGQLDAAEEDVVHLEDEERVHAATYLEAALELSRARRVAAAGFAERVVEVLATLAMPSVRLELARGFRQGSDLEVDGTQVGAAADGIDVGELVIATNPGEPPRPLARIASGGELSRIHLAMRTVLREARLAGDGLAILFDEVDAGIGGRVVEELARLLRRLGERDQVLVVTHLPQVAAWADAQFVVSKTPVAGRTVTGVRQVAGEERVEELVRMLGGGERTPAARQHAQELLGRR